MEAAGKAIGDGERKAALLNLHPAESAELLGIFCPVRLFLPRIFSPDSLISQE
jgi:hypothetical protein